MPSIQTLQNRQIQRLFNINRSFKLSPFLVFFERSKSAVSHYAIAVSRKLAAKVHARNRVRRQLRPLILQALTASMALMVVFLTLENYFDFSQAEIQRRLQLIIQQLHHRLKPA